MFDAKLYDENEVDKFQIFFACSRYTAAASRQTGLCDSVYDTVEVLLNKSIKSTEFVAVLSLLEAESEWLQERFDKNIKL